MNIKRIMLVRFSSMHEYAFVMNKTIPFDLKHIQAKLCSLGKNVVFIDQVVSPLVDIFKQAQIFTPDVILIEGQPQEYKRMELVIQSYTRIHPECVIVSKDCKLRDQDIVLTGEIEEDFIEVVERLAVGESSENLTQYYQEKYARGGPSLVEDLDGLTPIGYSKKELSQYKSYYPLRIGKPLTWGEILTSRGCPHQCNFCSGVIRKTYGKKVRLQNPSRVVSQMQVLKNQGVNIIAIQDDSFTSSPDHVRALCEEMLKTNIGLKWIAHARADEVDKDLLVLMKKSGCVLLRFGVESGSQRIIDLLKKTSSVNWREQCRQAFSLSHEIGIATHALFMIGNPDETEEEIMQSIAFAKELDADLIQVHFFTPYKEFVRGEDDGADYAMHHYQIAGSNPSRVESSRLHELYLAFYKMFYLRKSFVQKNLFSYMRFFLLNPEVGYRCVKTLLRGMCS